MIHALAVARDRLRHRFSRWGWASSRCGKGEFWILPGLHLVNRYKYLKVTFSWGKRTWLYEWRR